MLIKKQDLQSMHFYKFSEVGFRIMCTRNFLANFLVSVLLISILILNPIFLLNAYSVTPQSKSLIHSSSQSSESIVKGLLNGAIQSLNSGNVSNSLAHLKVVNQQLSTWPSTSASPSNQNSNLSSTWLQTTRLLVTDAIRELSNGNKEKAVTYITLAAQESGIRLQQSNQSSTRTPLTFVTYTNPLLGITIQHPSNWTVTEYPYNPQANNTIAAFFSNSKTGSELGNVSGVGGRFVPYLDIYTFDSKNMSLDKIVNGIIARFHNNTDIVINQSKAVTLKNNHPANLLLYTVNAADESFGKMQLYTIFGSKVFVVTFTSQAALRSNYLQTAQKMIQSFNVNTNKLTSKNF